LKHIGAAQLAMLKQCSLDPVNFNYFEIIDKPGCTFWGTQKSDSTAQAKPDKPKKETKSTPKHPT